VPPPVCFTLAHSLPYAELMRLAGVAALQPLLPSAATARSPRCDTQKGRFLYTDLEMAERDSIDPLAAGIIGLCLVISGMIVVTGMRRNPHEVR